MKSLAPDSRRRDLARIHILAAELGMDTHDQNPECEYRAMLWTLGRVRSAADLDHAGRQAVLDHLGKRKGTPAPRPERGGRPAFSAECGALGAKLDKQLEAAALPWSYAAGIAKRMFNVEHLEWCRPEQLRKIVAALEYSARRKAQS